MNVLPSDFPEGTEENHEYLVIVTCIQNGPSKCKCVMLVLHKVHAGTERTVFVGVCVFLNMCHRNRG